MKYIRNENTLIKAFTSKLQSPKAMNFTTQKAGILARPDVEAFPFAGANSDLIFNYLLLILFESVQKADLQLRDSSGFTPDSLLIFWRYT